MASLLQRLRDNVEKATQAYAAAEVRVDRAEAEKSASPSEIAHSRMVTLPQLAAKVKRAESDLADYLRKTEGKTMKVKTSLTEAVLPDSGKVQALYREIHGYSLRSEMLWDDAVDSEERTGRRNILSQNRHSCVEDWTDALHAIQSGDYDDAEAYLRSAKQTTAADGGDDQWERKAVDALEKFRKANKV